MGVCAVEWMGCVGVIIGVGCVHGGTLRLHEIFMRQKQAEIHRLMAGRSHEGCFHMHQAA